MTTQALPLPLMGLMAGFRRFSVAEYHRLTEIGVLTEDDNLELIEGWLIHKMSRNPPHDGTLSRVMKRLLPLLPPGWDYRSQMAITLADSEPEPDLAIVRQHVDGYLSRHPIAAEVGLLVEVSDSTLEGDRIDKGRIYARAGIPIYWIVNVPDRQIEVYTAPSGPTADPVFGQRQDRRSGDQVAFILDSGVIATLQVGELLG